SCAPATRCSCCPRRARRRCARSSTACASRGARTCCSRAEAPAAAPAIRRPLPRVVDPPRLPHPRLAGAAARSPARALPRARRHLGDLRRLPEVEADAGEELRAHRRAAGTVVEGAPWGLGAAAPLRLLLGRPLPLRA